MYQIEQIAEMTGRPVPELKRLIIENGLKSLRIGGLDKPRLYNIYTYEKIKNILNERATNGKEN